jgi:hypothetical protein
MVHLPEGKGYIFFSRSCKLAHGTQPSPVQYFGGAIYPWVNGHDVKRKSPYVAEVKNEWTYTSTYGFMAYINTY